MPKSAQNPSVVETTHFTLHNPTDRDAPAYFFNTEKEARAFKQKHALVGYRIALVRLFSDQNGSV